MLLIVIIQKVTPVLMNEDFGGGKEDCMEIETFLGQEFRVAVSTAGLESRS